MQLDLLCVVVPDIRPELYDPERVLRILRESELFEKHQIFLCAPQEQVALYLRK